MKTIDNTEIKDFLETVPLYTWVEYKRPSVNRATLLIDAIDSYCDICAENRPFHNLRAQGGGAGIQITPLKSGTTYYEFTCVSCRKEERIFHIEQIIDDSTITLQKFGELPRKKLPRDKELQAFFSEDSDYYEKAVVCMTNGYGIAAFAYYRRIIENNIHSLLDLLQDNSTNDPKADEISHALAELKKETPMSDKIKVANNALPDYLKPDGINPLGTLYKILSEGVHSLCDTDCLHKAEQINGCTKFLISELSNRKRNLSKFKGVINNLKG